MLRSSVRVLGARDLEAAVDLCATDPVSHAFVSSRLVGGLLGEAGRAEVWGYHQAGDLVSLCWVGANMVPVAAHGEAADAFAARARQGPRRSSSLFGPRDDVLRLWAGLEGTWGPAREVRGEQPLMVCERAEVEPHPEVRRTRPTELDTLFPASVAMFTEEIGYSPLGIDGGAGYKAGVAEMVSLGRSFILLEPGADGVPEVVFKAELGAVTGAVAQIQGVWVAPHRRGEGIAVPAVAAVVEAVRRDLGARSSLYVNDYNQRAIRVYERVGFVRHGCFATVLL
ncbi:GNAT family N-acetyltransferase [Aquipuribacter nitratireducens]|uniref:GNAT family N-acetyltransferase n=1 Tax=Aquipuribacter nitratireducens TaxID=650104 RepID=A0ABW0GPB6_9MICO